MKLHLLLFTLFFSCASYAQSSIDLITVGYQYGLPQRYEESLDGKATELVGLINLKLPVVLNEKNIWYNDVTYFNYLIEQEPDLPENLADPIRVHGIIFQTGWVHQIDDTRAFQFLVIPRLMGDFVNISTGHFQLGVIGLYEKRYRPGLMMRYGFLYNQDAFGPLLVPLAYVDWDFGNRWEMIGLFPIYLKVQKHLNRNLTVGFSHYGLVSSYRLTEEAYRNDYIERASIDLTLFGRIRLFGNFHAEGRIGYSLARHYEQYTANDKLDLKLSILEFGDNRIPLNTNFNDGPIASLRLVYNLQLEEDN